MQRWPAGLVWFLPLPFLCSKPVPRPPAPGAPWRTQPAVSRSCGLASLPPTSAAQPTRDGAHGAAPSVTFPTQGAPTPLSSPGLQQLMGRGDSGWREWGHVSPSSLILGLGSAPAGLPSMFCWPSLLFCVHLNLPACLSVSVVACFSHIFCFSVFAALSVIVRLSSPGTVCVHARACVSACACVHRCACVRVHLCIRLLCLSSQCLCILVSLCL